MGNVSELEMAPLVGISIAPLPRTILRKIDPIKAFCIPGIDKKHGDLLRVASYRAVGSNPCFRNSEIFRTRKIFVETETTPDTSTVHLPKSSNTAQIDDIIRYYIYKKFLEPFGENREKNLILIREPKPQDLFWFAGFLVTRTEPIKQIKPKRCLANNKTIKQILQSLDDYAEVDTDTDKNSPFQPKVNYHIIIADSLMGKVSPSDTFSATLFPTKIYFSSNGILKIEIDATNGQLVFLNRDGHILPTDYSPFRTADYIPAIEKYFESSEMVPHRVPFLPSAKRPYIGYECNIKGG